MISCFRKAGMLRVEIVLSIFQLHAVMRSSCYFKVIAYVLHVCRWKRPEEGSNTHFILTNDTIGHLQ